MAERDELAAALAAEVLGPRGGIRERLEAPPHRTGEFVTPLEEYICGVLAPRDGNYQPEIDSSEDLLGANDEADEHQSSPASVATPPGASPISGPGRSPTLDPRMRP